MVKLAAGQRDVYAKCALCSQGAGFVPVPPDYVEPRASSDERATALAQSGWDAEAQRWLQALRLCDCCKYYLRQAVGEAARAHEVLRHAHHFVEQAEIERLQAAGHLAPVPPGPAESESLRAFRPQPTVAALSPAATRREIDRERAARLERFGIARNQNLSDAEMADAMIRFAAVINTADFGIARTAGNCVGLWFAVSKPGDSRPILPIPPPALHRYVRALGDRRVIESSDSADQKVLAGDYDILELECNQRPGLLVHWGAFTDDTDVRCLVAVGPPSLDRLVAVCPCGSRRRYRDCHGKRIEQLQQQAQEAGAESHREALKIQMEDAVAEMWRLARRKAPAAETSHPKTSAAAELDKAERELGRITAPALKERLGRTLEGVRTQIAEGNLPPQPVAFEIWCGVRPDNAWEHAGKLRATPTGATRNGGDTHARLQRAQLQYELWTDETAPDALRLTETFGASNGELLAILGAHDDWSLAGELARAQVCRGSMIMEDPGATLETFAAALVYQGSPHLSGSEQQQLNPMIHTSYLSGGGPNWGPNYEERYDRSLREARQIVRFWVLLTCALRDRVALQHVIAHTDSRLIQAIATVVLERGA